MTVDQRNYVDSAPVTSLTGAATAQQTSLSVVDLQSWPPAPFVAVVDQGEAAEEIVYVTSVAGTVLTVTRDYDGRGAFTHPTGATVGHVAIAKDLQEANDHHRATAGVHGVVGDIVGTTATQTLSNKTFTAPTINGGSFVGVDLGGKVRVSHTFTLSGLVRVPAGDAGFVPPFYVPVSKSAKIVGVKCRINSGTSVTCQVQVNGVAVTGLDALTVTSTVQTVAAGANTLADGDVVGLVVSAVAGNPQNLSLSVFVEYGV